MIDAIKKLVNGDDLDINADALMKGVTEVRWDIGPERAQELLDTMPEGGNPRWRGDKDVNQDHVNKLARDMMLGRFIPVDPILIHEDGHINGIHRLHAIIQSGVTLNFLVRLNVPVLAKGFEDLAIMKKSLDQGANALGIDWLADRNATTIVNGMVYGYDQSSDSSFWEQIDFAERHKEAVLFTLAQFKGETRKGLTIQPVQSAVARAYYHIPEEDLERFVRCLNTGIPRREDEASVIRLRDFLMKQAYKAYGSADRKEKYGKTARAILAVRDGQVLQSLRAVKEDPFPIPGEKGWTG